MAAYKVINLDSPIESDYWVDIPVRDPATNKDAVDEKGRILVERHVTRSVKNKELATINTAVETVNTLKEDYSTFKGNVSTKIDNHDSSILTNTNKITTLTDSVNNHDLQIHALYSKINAIKGIDIDDFKYVTETDIKNIKKNYLPLAGGTLTGNVSIQTPNTAVLTLTPSSSSSYASFSTNNDVLNCTTTWGKVFKVSEEGKYFYGLADKAIADKNNNDITTTYATKTENTSNLASAKAYADTKKNEAITSANSYTDQEKAKYLPLHSKADTADRIQSSLQTESYYQGNYGNVLVNSTANAGSYVMLSRLHSTSGWFTHGIYLGMYLLQYTSQATVNTGVNKVDKSVTLLDEAGNTSFCGTVTAPAFSTNRFFISGYEISIG